MAFQHPHPHPHHHPQNPHITTTSSYCCCQTTSCPQPPPPAPPPLSSPSTTIDPFLIAAIVSQLHQTHNPNPNPNPHPPNFAYSHHVNPPTTTTTTSTINLSHANPSQHQHQSHPLSPFFISLLQRIDALEASLHRFSSSDSFPRLSLRDAAARTIQSHFRAFLVHRSRTLRHLHDLASIKSSLASLKSSLSRHCFIDFDFFSHKAMDLLLKLDSIQSGDKMIRDSKRSVTREIVEFLELLDGACVKRHQALLTRKVKNMRIVRNDSGAVHDKRGSFKQHNAGPKCRNVGNEEKKLMANLRERVEKIGRMSKALEEQEQDVLGDAEIKGFKNGEDEDDDIIGQVANNYRLKNRVNVKNNALGTNAKKRVCFVEDGNMIRVYDADGDSGSTSRLVDVIEDPTKGAHEEEEAHSDGEGSSQSSEDLRKGTNDEDCDNQNEDFTFSTPEPSKKMGTGTDFLSKKSGLKTVG